MERFFYDIRWSNLLDERFIADFLYVQKEVFHCGSREEFKRQFEKNIYGPSIIVVVYDDDKPIAARAFWRNDIYGKVAYQPGSTCVLSSFRGKGIFKEMTMRVLKLIDHSIIYNFPNQNSFPGYLKMGWKLLHNYGMRLLTSYKEYSKEHPIMMDDAYAEWWVSGKSFNYIKFRGHYFLVHRDHRVLCFRVVAEVSEYMAKQFSRKRIGFFFYKSEYIPWYSKHFALNHVVAVNMKDGEYVPTWKIDAL